MEVYSKYPKEEIKAEKKLLFEFRSPRTDKGEFDFFCRLGRGGRRRACALECVAKNRTELQPSPVIPE